MWRVSNIVVLLMLSGCPSRDECPSSALTGGRRRMLSPVGVQQFSVGWDDHDGGVAVRVNIFRDGGFLGEAMPAGADPRFNGISHNSWFNLEVDQPGPLEVRIEASCNGHVIDTETRSELVSPTLVATHRLPRACGRLEPLDDEPTRFDCNGVVVDADGGALAGYVTAQDVRVAWRDGGVERWVLNDGKLQLENERGLSNAVDFTVGVDTTWFATTDFAVSANEFVLASDAGLEAFEFDRTAVSADYEACAVASNGTRRLVIFRPAQYIVLEQPTYIASESLLACAVELGAHATLGTCDAYTGKLIRQERRANGVVLLQVEREIQLFDLLNRSSYSPGIPLPPLTSLWAGFAEVQGRFYAVDGYEGYFEPTSPTSTVVPVLPSWSASLIDWPQANPPRPQSSRFNHQASSDFVWGFDTEAPSNGTYWTRLR